MAVRNLKNYFEELLGAPEFKPINKRRSKSFKGCMTRNLNNQQIDDENFTVSSVKKPNVNATFSGITSIVHDKENVPSPLPKVKTLLKFFDKSEADGSGCACNKRKADKNILNNDSHDFSGEIEVSIKLNRCSVKENFIRMRKNERPELRMSKNERNELLRSCSSGSSNDLQQKKHIQNEKSDSEILNESTLYFYDAKNSDLDNTEEFKLDADTSQVSVNEIAMRFEEKNSPELWFDASTPNTKLKTKKDPQLSGLFSPLFDDEPHYLSTRSKNYIRVNNNKTPKCNIRSSKEALTIKDSSFPFVELKDKFETSISNADFKESKEMTTSTPSKSVTENGTKFSSKKINLNISGKNSQIHSNQSVKTCSPTLSDKQGKLFAKNSSNETKSNEPKSFSKLTVLQNLTDFEKEENQTSKPLFTPSKTLVYKSIQISPKPNLVTSSKPELQYKNSKEMTSDNIEKFSSNKDNNSDAYRKKERSSSISSSAPSQPPPSQNFSRCKMRRSNVNFRELHKDELKFFGLKSGTPQKDSAANPLYQKVLKKSVLNAQKK